jgi:hypothetical protein
MLSCVGVVIFSRLCYNSFCGFKYLVRVGTIFVSLISMVFPPLLPCVGQNIELGTPKTQTLKVNFFTFFSLFCFFYIIYFIYFIIFPRFS